MPLWGATDSDESKPKNLTTAEKKQVFANASGWVLEAGSALSGNDNTSAQPEVLVAIGGLAESLGAADITEIEFITTAFDKSDGGTLQVRVRFNEPVDVDTSGGTLYNGNILYRNTSGAPVAPNGHFMYGDSASGNTTCYEVSSGSVIGSSSPHNCCE